MIDKDHVFALVSNVALDYAGAGYVNSQNVPDIGGQPIDNAYNTYRNLFDIYGESYPRNGKPGLHGKLYGGTEVYRYFKVRFPNVPLKAGVVEFNQSDSERFGNSIVEGLRLEGYTVVVKVVNFALPDFNSVAIAFKHAGVQYVYDALDSCRQRPALRRARPEQRDAHREGADDAGLEPVGQLRLRVGTQVPQRAVGDRQHPQLRGHAVPPGRVVPRSRCRPTATVARSSSPTGRSKAGPAGCGSPTLPTAAAPI